jgi:predicted Zn-dependent protease
VRLTSTTQLTKTSWIATILHELGHVAGLNHVARRSEVMYPEIDAGSPVAYGSGDLAGFGALQAVRSA